MAEWWEEAFRADYLRVYPHRDDREAAREVEDLFFGLIEVEPGSRVLDLACGAGRHLRALEAKGLHPVGADFSADLLAEARRSGAKELVRCDMRVLPFQAGEFSVVSMFFNSFGYFKTDEEDASVLREVARVLISGGWLHLELMNPAAVARHLIPRSEITRDGVEILEERSLDEDGRKVRKRVTLRRDGGVRSWTEVVRLYSDSEVLKMARSAGLASRAISVETGERPWSHPVRRLFSFEKAAE